MPGTQTFDPNEFFVTVGALPIVQFAKGTYVTITYDSDAMIDDVGATGNVVRVLQTDLRATVKLVLQAESPSNDYLNGLLITDRASGEGTLPLFVKDGRGTTIATSAQAWVKKAPDQPFSSTEAVTREWEIRCAQLVGIVGGRLVL